MSYTRPSANDADASWLGAAAYTRPPAEEVDGSFLSSYLADPLPESTFGEATSSLIADPLPEGTLGEPSEPSVDPYFANVVLLLHGELRTGLSPAIIDDSPTSKACTATATFPVASPKQFGDGALRCVGTTGVEQARVEISHATDFAIGSSDFTIEAWVRLTAVNIGRQPIIRYANSNDWFDPTEMGYEIFLGDAGGGEWKWGYTLCEGATSSGGVPIAAGPAAVADTWTHLALVRGGDFVRFYVDGVRVSNQAGFSGDVFNNPSGATLRIGQVPDGLIVDRYFDEVRVTKGVARYSGASFTLQTAPYRDLSVTLPADSLTGTLGEPTGVQRWPADSLPSGELPAPSIVLEAASIVGEFGLPSAALEASTLPAGALGEPSGYQWWGADPLPAGTFGVPDLAHEAVPLPTSTIGEPAGWQNYRASSIPVGTFGTPTTPTDRSGTAASLDASPLGQPVATATTPTVGLGRIARASPITSSPPTDAGALWDVSAGADPLSEGTLGTPRLSGATGVGYICYAGGLPESTWGEPVGGWDVAEEASALPAGTIPGAASALSGDAATLPSQTPSAAVAILLQRMTSLTGAMGVPLVGRAQTAAGLGPSTFGTPKSAQSDTYVPFPLPSSWFGQPVGFSRFEYPADALPAGSLGEPAAYETHLATSIYSTTEFGTPLLRRDALC